ncbi:acyl carrier protein [Streptomyces sp. B21-083]|uniref:acyl carrier protein n=1 Tax=Streptomyces sp. B21-083 TaxID=3039410 RepID=UPI002FF3534A
MPPSPHLLQRIAGLVAEASEGAVSQDAALAEGRTLTELGLTSLSYLRLIDALENEFGVYIDLEEDTAFLGSVDGLVQYLDGQGVTAQGSR